VIITFIDEPLQLLADGVTV
jgi:hypothetical protein